MTPAELIETALREHMRLKITRTTIEHAQRGWPIWMSGTEAEDAARIAADALAGAGKVVVSTEDLEDAIDALAEREDVCFGSDCSDEHCQRVLRLRAALPERTTDA